MDHDLQPPIVAPIQGAHPEARHPLRGTWRGLREVATFFGQCAVALFEMLAGRGLGRPRRRKPHPVEKAAPFPIND